LDITVILVRLVDQSDSRKRKNVCILGYLKSATKCEVDIRKQ